MTATCACGQASITLSAMPLMMGVCHCQNCKRRTGSAFGISAYFDRSVVAAQEGRTRVYAFHHAARGHDQERHFCVKCGTTLFWFISSLPGHIGVAGGCLAGQGLPEPGASANDAQREPWVSLPGHWVVHHD